MMTLQLFDDMTRCSEAEVQRLLPLVSAQRREQALRFKHLHGRFTCLKSYEMLKQCVAEILADDSENLMFRKNLQHWNGHFVYNEHGKPFMQDSCTMKAIESVDFSISHCKNGIVVALSDRPIGVDIESFHHAEPSLLRKTMNEREIAEIQNAVNPKIMFTRLWTQKEALLKLQGTGIVDELPDVLSALPQLPYTMQSYENIDKEYVYTVICG